MDKIINLFNYIESKISVIDMDMMLLILINMIVVFIITLKEEHLSAKGNKSRINLFALFIKNGISLISSSITIAVFSKNVDGKFVLILSIIVGYISARVIYDKFLNNEKLNFYYKTKKRRKFRTELSEEKLDDDDLEIIYNLITPKVEYTPDIEVPSASDVSVINILYLYGFISKNHLLKLMKSSIYETTDEMVCKLLDRHVLNEKELKLARAITNIIRMENRFLEKDEIVDILKNYNKADDWTDE